MLSLLVVASIIFCIIIFLFVAIKFYFKWSFSYWDNLNVYSIPPTIPFGNAKEHFKGNLAIGLLVAQAYKHIKDKGLPYGGIYFLTKPILVLTDINLIRDVFITNFEHFPDHSILVNEDKDPLNAHLFNLPFNKWKDLRAKFTPHFTIKNLKLMLPLVKDCAKNFHYVLDEAAELKKPLDLRDVFAKYTTDVISSVGFGIECNSLKNPNSEMRVYGKKSVRGDRRAVFLRKLNVFNPKLLEFFGLKVTNDLVEKFFMKVIRETLDYRKNNNIERRDFVQFLLEIKNKEKNNFNNANDEHESGLTLNQIAAQMFMFFQAGFEPPAAALNFFFYEIANDLKIQEKLRDEMKKVLTSYDNEITYDSLNEMTFLDKCVLETFRKYPSAPLLPRVCTKDYKVPNSDLIIEKNTAVMITAYGIHHDPEFYPNPEKFDPERFSEENKVKRPSASYVPFGEGPRICIGSKLGLTMVKIAIVSLLTKYKFTLNEKTMLPINFHGNQFILTAYGGMWVNAYKL